MTDDSDFKEILLALLGLPLVLVVLSVFWMFYLCEACWRVACPNCWIPFGRRILSNTFEYENIKFHLDHYKVSCECRFCGHSWDYEKIRSPDPELHQSASEVEPTTQPPQ